jgi:hypothetical protein
MRWVIMFSSGIPWRSQNAGTPRFTKLPVQVSQAGTIGWFHMHWSMAAQYF